MITKKEIKQGMTVIRLAGFHPNYKYFFRHNKLEFSYHTNRNELEMWDKDFNGKIDEYPGSYFSLNGYKDEFIDMVQFLINNQ